MTEEDHQRQQSIRKQISKTVQKNPQRKLHESVMCGCWHPPECQHHTTESGCKFGERCVFKHTEVDSQSSEQPNKSGGQGSAIRLCVSGCRATEIHVDFTEEHEVLGTEAQLAFL